eukprot:6535876-Prymnesium_polylepis.2
MCGAVSRATGAQEPGRLRSPDVERRSQSGVSRLTGVPTPVRRAVVRRDGTRESHSQTPDTGQSTEATAASGQRRSTDTTHVGVGPSSVRTPSGSASCSPLPCESSERPGIVRDARSHLGRTCVSSKQPSPPPGTALA